MPALSSKEIMSLRSWMADRLLELGLAIIRLGKKIGGWRAYDQGPLDPNG